MGFRLVRRWYSRIKARPHQLPNFAKPVAGTYGGPDVLSAKRLTSISSKRRSWGPAPVSWTSQSDLYSITTSFGVEGTDGEVVKTGETFMWLTGDYEPVPGVPTKIPKLGPSTPPD